MSDIKESVRKLLLVLSLFKEKISITVEGNIGSGKSSLIERLQKEIADLEVLKENVEDWKDVEGLNLLDGFYKDMEANAFPFQSYVFSTRYLDHEEEQTSALRVSERCPLSDYLFMKNLYLREKLSEYSWVCYRAYYSALMKRGYRNKPDFIIYLDTDADECHARKVGRGRPEENADLRNYMHDLEERHQEWLPNELYGITEDHGIHIPYLKIKEPRNFVESDEVFCSVVDTVADLLSRHFSQLMTATVDVQMDFLCAPVQSIDVSF